jgi:hypothetical protein
MSIHELMVDMVTTRAVRSKVLFYVSALRGRGELSATHLQPHPQSYNDKRL